MPIHLFENNPLVQRLERIADSPVHNDIERADLIQYMRNGGLRLWCQMVLDDQRFAERAAALAYPHAAGFDKIILAQLGLANGRLMQFRLHRYRASNYLGVSFRREVHEHRFDQWGEVENGGYARYSLRRVANPSHLSIPFTPLRLSGVGSSYQMTQLQKEPVFLEPFGRDFFAKGSGWHANYDIVHLIAAAAREERPDDCPQLTFSYFLDPGYVTETTTVYRPWQSATQRTDSHEIAFPPFSFDQIRELATEILACLDKPWTDLDMGFQWRNFAKLLPEETASIDHHLSSQNPHQQALQASLERRQ